MSLATYLATNFTLPFTEDDDKKILVGECFSTINDREKVKKHFSNKYVYEIFTDENIGFWFNDEFKEEYPDDNLKSQEDFFELCRFLDTYLEIGAYCEIYICWVGEEEEERNKEYDRVINLSNLDIEKVQIYEKTLLIIRK
ncbi:hypothetical protein [Priestia megaterium]|uniref:hypothetical protein n=1 Tax=Priestia megaterium TaxID=1404 RepID=UPI003D063941